MRDVLVGTTVDRARSIVVQRRMTDQRPLIRTVHPDEISQNPETGEMFGMDLVATFKHIQNEFYTHMFNSPESKITLWIDPVVRLPDAGYHMASCGTPSFQNSVWHAVISTNSFVNQE